MAEPWLKRDYTALWQLPPPLPPRPLPLIRLGAVIAVIVAGLMVGLVDEIP